MRSSRRERRVLIIFNPAAGRHRRQRLAAVLDRLRALGCAFDVRETSGPGDAERFAREADAGHHDVVVVAGGDGTVNETINGLAGKRLPLAIVPLGTANVLAAEIGLATDPASVAGTIAHGTPLPIALGCANGRRFILMAGAGFDAHVVRDVSVTLKRRLGKGAYIYAMLRQLLLFPFRPYRVRLEGRPFKAASIVVANGRFYAGRHLCAPKGALHEPHLEVCLFERGGRLSVIGYALALVTGRLPGLATFRVISTAGPVEIEGIAGEPLQGDGDIIGRLHCRIEVLPAALDLVFPPGAAPAATACAAEMVQAAD